MMSTEMGGGGGRGGGGMVAGGGGNIDPSNLHLKKELTQIRKAARVLRDPGTSSTWRSPLNSARSLSKHHYVHHHKNGQVDGNSVVSSSEQFLQVPSNSKNYGSGNVGTEKGNLIAKEKERRVFLYNWRSQKSESERSKQIGEDDVENIKDDGSYSSHDESVDVDSLSDARNGGENDSKSDTYLSEKYSSAIFKCRNTDFTPSIRRTIKKKSRRSNCSNASLRHHKEKLQKHIILSRCAKDVVEGLPGLVLGREDLVDQSDDTEDYCNSEDLRRASALSPLLARLKNKGWPNSSTKLLRSEQKEDDSISYSTPALSTSSYNKYGARKPSMVESWDAATGSFNDADDEVEDQLDLPGRHGCGIPCYWSRRSTPKSRVGYRSCCSPSLSDTLRRRGSSIFCGSQSVHQRRHHRSSLVSNKRRLGSRTGGQSLVPLLTNSANGQGGSSMGSGNSDDELSTNFEELDLEALSRLDGRRWSSCRSQEGLELVALNGEVHDESSPENARSLSHKYRPMFFDELVGQNIVVQSLMTAVSRGRIAPVYLFQGPRGTGKTSSARIFAAALNCLATEDTKPCGVCRECADFISGKSTCLREVDGSNKKGVGKIKILLKSLSVVHPSAPSLFRVFVVNECHLLPSKTWLTFLQLLEKPLPHVVFILITTDIDNVPRTILSRCQKQLFNKISNGDIVARLSKIADDENMDVESDALELIASNADGSLRDAETMLDQLSLFGKRITISLVNELIGVVSDEKLLDLLELAMSSNATETVIRARELMDSGVDPIVLMSQMATLIVDIIAGTYPNVDGKPDSFFGGRNLSERELDRLKHALTLLSEAEKHLRVASERSTWFTATLLQLGSVASLDRTHSGSSRRQSSKATDEDHVIRLRESTAQKQRTDSQLEPEKSASPSKSFPRVAHRNSTSKDNPVQQTEASSFNPNPNQSQFINSEALTASQGDGNGGRIASRCVNSKMLTNIWLQCIEKCHSKTLRQLLHAHGRLVSICEAKGGFVAHVAFGDRNIKTRAEGFLSSITNSFEMVLQRNVDVKIIILPDTLLQKQTDKSTATNLENKSTRLNVAVSNCDLNFHQEPSKLSTGSFNIYGSHQMKPFDSIAGNPTMSASKENKSGIPVKRIESIIHEQRLETAWLQAMEKGTPGSMSHLKPERNQVLPQDSTYPPNQLEAMNSTDVSVQHWEDELNHEIKALKISDGAVPQKDQIGRRIDHYPISPSLLHNSSFASNFSKENMGYESGSGAGGCSGMFCWNNTRPQRRGKAKQGTPLRSRRSGRFSWFGECAKSRRTDSRYNR
ncbi:protein STICHEL isoform X1 [Sesamum indicum]|uniref:Protein STICHEL isoform X1 n=1 Tax=Sesamum indicum TaxID=4182 RepID=A0A6I9U5L1_SESIN|nr:protein STICHEL isoform X1 [Sesamum indicum]